MIAIRVEELERNPAALLARVEAGEHVIVVRDDHPVAELRPIAPWAAGARPFGLCAGEFVAPDDFDAPLPEGVLRSFEGQ